MLTKHQRDAQGPAPDERVESLLTAAAAPTEPGPVPGEAAALAAFRVATQTTESRRSRMLSSRNALKTAAAATIGTGMLLTGGVAAAATGSLPGAAQDTASEMLAKVGVTVPGVDEHGSEYADQRGTADKPSQAAPDATGTEADDTAEPAEGADSGKGEEVSELATDTDSSGVEKGAEVSGLASDGQSQAGEHGDAQAQGNPAAPDARPDAAGGAAQSSAAEENAPVEVPNSGGTGTADDASSEQGGGASTSGTDTADGASGGRSSAGSDNRP